MVEIKRQIFDKLRDLAIDNSVIITYAAESGSRAWGFASPDSDYDVRFIYYHPVEHYLSLFDHRDTIEWMSDDKMFDFVGWDIKKALNLLYKSNPTLIEWLISNQVYVDYYKFRENVMKLAHEQFSHKALMWHYYSMAYNNWTKYIVPVARELVKDKKYFYVLRPLLNILWIDRYKTIPPIDFETVINNSGIEMTIPVWNEIKSMLHNKRLNPESACGGSRLITRGYLLDSFIEQTLVACKEMCEAAEPRKLDREELDKYFINFIRNI